MLSGVRILSAQPIWRTMKAPTKDPWWNMNRTQAQAYLRTLEKKVDDGVKENFGLLPAGDDEWVKALVDRDHLREVIRVIDEDLS